jgi:hypothetical protein
VELVDDVSRAALDRQGVRTYEYEEAKKAFCK